MLGLLYEIESVSATKDGAIFVLKIQDEKTIRFFETMFKEFKLTTDGRTFTMKLPISISNMKPATQTGDLWEWMKDNKSHIVRDYVLARFKGEI